MIKLNLDICTTRRLSGWIFNMDDLSPVEELFIESGANKVKIELTDRADVAEAFGLKHLKFGIEVNIPDAFDSVVNDYKLYYRNQEIFSYRSQYQKLEEAVSGVVALSNNDSTSTHKTNYKRERHILFLYETKEHKEFFEVLSQPLIRRSFPRKIAGCEFSSQNVNSLDQIKKDLLENLKNILVVIPSNLYEKLNRISPTLVASGKFITLYGDGGLSSRTGLHEHQLNNFVMRKTREENTLPLYKASIIRIWEVIENYADLIFNKNQNLFFIISKITKINPVLSQYISNKIQAKRSEDIIRIRTNQTELILLNISAYSKLFDKIGSEDCWNTAIKRGLRHLDLVI